jgi:hypothetical protein
VNRTLAAILILVVIGSGAAGLAHADQISGKIAVEAGDYTRIDTPVSVVLEGIDAVELGLEEIRGEERSTVMAQIEDGNPRRLWWFLSGVTKPGEKRCYELVAGRSLAEQSSTVDVRKNDSSLEIRIGDKSVLRYNHAPVPPPQGAGELYTRSGFIHPLWSPGGEVLTWMHPTDHIHHMGLWNPWTKTRFEGRDVDFWNLGKGEGTVRFAGFDSIRPGPVFGQFCALQEHVDLSAPGGQKPALNETLTVRVWNTGTESNYWLLDYTTSQRCASSSPVQLLKYRYGGLGFRATQMWHESNSDYLTSDGKSRKDGHGTRARWCNVFGSTDKGDSGVLFMSHPENREHPEPMRIWPEGHVFFNFCPVQNKDWTLEPGNEYFLRYRMYVYEGSIGPEQAERLWRDFAYPPKVTLEKTK